MVLQQGINLPVWGTAAPGEEVTVTVGAESAKATAGSDGTWKVALDPLKPGTAAFTMTVAGKNTLTYQDVVVGDVWVCSGQSNMEFALNRAHNQATELPKATDTQLRLFIVARHDSHLPQTEVKAGSWFVCNPAQTTAFSAVGYFFGRDLRQKLGYPIGLIGTYWGGTPAQAWTSLTGLQKEPSLQHYVDDWQKIAENYASAIADWPAAQAKLVADEKAWLANGGQAYKDAMTKWKAFQVAPDPKLTPPPQPTPPPTAEPPNKLRDPDGGPGSPCTLFNGMIAPIVPYGIKGAIWYQGEANANQADEYHILFPRMITDWREHWAEGDFPFLFVQLAAYNPSANESWPRLREAQAETLSLPATGMVTAIDIGPPHNIHPMDKMDVGDRLARVAYHVAYGQTLVSSGPVYKSFQKNGSSFVINFTELGSGLVIGSSPWVDGRIGSTPLPADHLLGFPLPTDHLVGFTIAGEDHKWVAADAKIDGDTVVVSSPTVPNPVAVRYAFTSYPEGNLYNKEMLPAFPFRTDDWPDPALKVAPTPAPTPKP